jgi:hypothetical protein
MASSDYDTEAQVSGSAPAPGRHDDLFRKLVGWYKEDIQHVNKWRKEAEEDFKFYAGDQWSEEDQRILKEQRRPGLTFNRIGPLINAIVGAEINNRREVRFFPREEGDAKANEVLSAAAEWFRDQCGAEDEETDGFKSTTISGMGWTDTRLDFEENPDGDPAIEKIDAFEMVWDCNARKPNLTDSRRLFRVREMPVEDAKELTGVSDPKKLHAAWVKTADSPVEQHDQDAADSYDGTQNDQAEIYQRKKCVVVEARWLEREAYYRGPDPLNPLQPKEYDVRQFEALDKLYREQNGGQPFPAVKQHRKVVRRCFIGSEVLGDPDKPMVPPGMFGWECITGYKDEKENQWYGVVRCAKDPARWSNKFFSQVQYLLNSQSKGGIMAERGAFEDPRQAESSWAKADAITWVKDGAISGANPMILPKSPAQFPAGFFTLFQESKEAINEVTGLSLEFIGTREVDQAGVLEYQRRQSSLNLLAELFNALRRYRKRQGRVMLYLIQEHLADGRLIKIVGDTRKEYVPLSRASVANKEYDVIVDDSPSSPNERERTWQMLMQFLPMVKEMITPEIALELLELSPLPASTVEKLRRKAAEMAAQPKPPTPEEIKARAMERKAQLDAQGKVMDLQAQERKNEMDVQMKGIDLMMKVQEAQIDQSIAEQKLDMDMQKIAVQEQANAVARKNAAADRTASASK